MPKKFNEEELCHHDIPLDDYCYDCEMLDLKLDDNQLAADDYDFDLDFAQDDE